MFTSSLVSVKLKMGLPTMGKKKIQCMFQLSKLTNKRADYPCKLHNTVLVRVSQINRQRVVGVHQGEETINQVADVLERSGLLSLPINLISHADRQKSIKLKVTNY
ncbi:hypothetical protein ElyMa_002540900 [Elysia marginata]|uniref:Uncharacterized protein n=1 Tax=Elysia marginata TaxID=1093978 RepID=A0AAV4GXW9_9GAST|nr:hypothetical protein ElyMa_002540900 [Elysia marginata]